MTRYTILLLKDSPVEGPQKMKRETGLATPVPYEYVSKERIINRDTLFFLRATGYIFGTYFSPSCLSRGGSINLSGSISLVGDVFLRFINNCAHTSYTIEHFIASSNEKIMNI